MPPTLEIALKAAKARLARMQADQNDLLKKLAELHAEKQDLSGSELTHQVISRMEADKRFINACSQKIRSEGIKVHYAISSHKFEQTFADTKELLKHSDDIIPQIASGKLPAEYTALSNFDSAELPIIDYDTAAYYWGTYKVTTVSSLLHETCFTLSGKTASDVSLASSIFHVAPSPGGILDPKCSFAYFNKKGIVGFGFPHAGYAYGGSRNQRLLYPKEKLFCPEDCTSGTAKIVGCPEDTFNSKELYKSFFDPDHPLCTFFTPISYPMKYDHVEPGSVVAIYSSKGNWNNKEGYSGHCGIVVNKDQRGVLVLSYNRRQENPRIEGLHEKHYELGGQLLEGQFPLGDFSCNTSRALFFKPKVSILDQVKPSQQGSCPCPIF